MRETQTNIQTHNNRDKQTFKKKKFVVLNSLNVETVVQTFLK